MEPNAAGELGSHVPIMRVGKKTKNGDDVIISFIFLGGGCQWCLVAAMELQLHFRTTHCRFSGGTWRKVGALEGGWRGAGESAPVKSGIGTERRRPLPHWRELGEF